jgi:hypothetical protein
MQGLAHGGDRNSAMSWCRLAEIVVATIVIAVAFILALPFFLTLATLFVGGS